MASASSPYLTDPSYTGGVISSTGATTNRKRPRSTSPYPPTSSAATASFSSSTRAPKRQATQQQQQQQNDAEASGAILRQHAAAIRSKDESTRNTMLNELLKSSMDGNLTLGISGEVLLTALMDLLWEEMKLDKCDLSSIPETEKDAEFDFDPVTAWSSYCGASDGNRTRTRLPASVAAIRHYLQTTSLTHRTNYLPFVLMILRNLSFLAANLRIMAYHRHPSETKTVPSSSDTNDADNPSGCSTLALLLGSLYEPGYKTGSSKDHRANSLANIRDGTYTAPTSSSRDAGDSASQQQSLAASALTTLTNLVPHLDPTGQKLLCDKHFVDPSTIANDFPGLLPTNSEEFGLVGPAQQGGFGAFRMTKWLLDAKEADYLDVPQEMVIMYTSHHVRLVRSWLDAWAYIIMNPKSQRSNLMLALDWMKENMENHVGSIKQLKAQGMPTLRGLLLEIPQEVVDRLLDLLYVPRLGPDAVDYQNPLHNMVSRVQTLKLMGTYDVHVDTDVRDRVLDVLLGLIELDPPTMGAMIGKGKRRSHPYGTTEGARPASSAPRTRFWDALLPILTSKSGRNEAPYVALQLVHKLKEAPENQIGLEYLKERLLLMASGSSGGFGGNVSSMIDSNTAARIAQVVVGSIFNKNVNAKRPTSDAGNGIQGQQEEPAPSSGAALASNSNSKEMKKTG